MTYGCPDVLSWVSCGFSEEPMHKKQDANPTLLGSSPVLSSPYRRAKTTREPTILFSGLLCAEFSLVSPTCFAGLRCTAGLLPNGCAGAFSYHKNSTKTSTSSSFVFLGLFYLIMHTLAFNGPNLNIENWVPDCCYGVRRRSETCKTEVPCTRWQWRGIDCRYPSGVLTP